MEKLTKKEQEVYNLICKKGITKTKDIAEEMHISVNTVRTRLQHIFDKTFFRSKSELIYDYWKKSTIRLKAIIKHELKGK